MEVIPLGFDGGVGKDTGGFLEGGGGEEGLSLKGGLGDTKDEWLSDRWTLAL